MNRSFSIAFWTYVVPMVATRSMRIGLALFAFFALGTVTIFLSGNFSQDFMIAALQGTRRFLVMLGLPVAAVLVGEMALRDGISVNIVLNVACGWAAFAAGMAIGRTM